MREKNIPRAIEQEVSAALVDVFVAVILPLHPLRDNLK